VILSLTMGKKGKKAQAGKPKKLTPKDIGKRLNVLVKKVEEELEGADLLAPLPPVDDCAICLVPLPRASEEIVKFYQACCGNKNFKGRKKKKKIKKNNTHKRDDC